MMEIKQQHELNLLFMFERYVGMKESMNLLFYYGYYIGSPSILKVFAGALWSFRLAADYTVADEGTSET